VGVEAHVEVLGDIPLDARTEPSSLPPTRLAVFKRMQELETQCSCPERRKEPPKWPGDKIREKPSANAADKSREKCFKYLPNSTAP
jgi:hypothetical protein